VALRDKAHYIFFISVPVFQNTG